jgi:predicted Zn-ribbon and HTH transcriptional regulator
MSHKSYTVTERTIYVAQCEPCEFKDVRVESPPREIQCPKCKAWKRYEKQSWTGKDFNEEGL